MDKFHNMKLFDKVTCLCLDQRVQHWEDLERSCYAMGWKLDKFIAGDGQLIADRYKYNWKDTVNPDVSGWGYGGLGRKHHHYNAFNCHKQMIEQALSKNCQRVLFLEDDAYITGRFHDVMYRLAPAIRSLDFDLLYLGWWLAKTGEVPEFEEGYNLDKTCGIFPVTTNLGGLHGVIISKKMMEFIYTFPANNPIDCQLNIMGHNRFKSYYVAPKVIHTKTMMSITEGCIMERPIL